eukprot:3402757-Pyramimonas_sp.AAC.1
MRYLLAWKAGNRRAQGRRAGHSAGPQARRRGHEFASQFCVARKWQVSSANVKSAVLRSGGVDCRVYGVPGADVRRDWEGCFFFQSGGTLLARKPAFGDVRAPKEWWAMADSALAYRHF